MDAQNRSLFISSCSRRQLARRRGGRAGLRMQVVLAVAVLVALAVFAGLYGI